MKTTVDMEISVSGGRIIKAQTWTNGVCKLTIEVDPKPEEKQNDVPSKTPTEMRKTPTKISETEQGQGSYGRGYEDPDDFFEWDQTGCLG